MAFSAIRPLILIRGCTRGYLTGVRGPTTARTSCASLCTLTRGVLRSLPTTLPAATYSSSPDKGENEVKKTKKRRKKAKSSSEEGSPTKVSQDTSEKVPKQEKTTKKRGRKRKSKNTESITDSESPGISKQTLIGHFVPFEGTTKVLTPDTNPFDTYGLHNGLFSFDRQDSLEGRLYHIKPTDKRNKSVYSFPSVTTILENTMENANYYRLLNWKRKLMAEHGTEGFDMIVKNTMKSGSDFHKDLERQLSEKAAGSKISSKLSRPAKESPPSPTPLYQQCTDTVKSSSQPCIIPSTPPPPISDVKGPEEMSGKADQTNMSETSPTISDPSPTISYPSPTNSDPSPTNSDPSPTNSNPSPTKSDPSPTISDPSPTISYPSPTNSDPSSTNSDPDSDVPTPPVQYMQSVNHVLKDIGQVVAMETPVAHFELGYMGTFDCLAEYRGRLCLIDWKTSTRLKPSLADCYDYPLQAVAYAGAINQDPNINLKVLNLLIVIAYASGEPAHAHLINHQLCQKYWLKWIQRLQTYQTRFAEDLSEVIS